MRNESDGELRGIACENSAPDAHSGVKQRRDDREPQRMDAICQRAERIGKTERDGISKSQTSAVSIITHADAAGVFDAKQVDWQRSESAESDARKEPEIVAMAETFDQVSLGGG